jgi:DNA-binding transcriptional regulator YiaG
MHKSLSAIEAVKLRAWLASGQATQLRRGAGLSRAALARDIGVAESALLRWENGERRPTGLYAVAYYRSLARRMRAAGPETPLLHAGSNGGTDAA